MISANYRYSPGQVAKRPSGSVNAGIDNRLKFGNLDDSPALKLSDYSAWNKAVYTLSALVLRALMFDATPGRRIQITGPYAEPSDYRPFFKDITPVSFKAMDGVTLHGDFIRAEQPSGTTVILGHGHRSKRAIWFRMAEALVSRGYNVLMFDFRGCGESEGNRVSIGFHEGKDILAAMRFIKGNYGDAEGKQLHYMGHSGGAAAWMLLGMSLRDFPEELEWIQKNISKVVLDSPYSQIKMESSRLFEKATKFERPGGLLKHLSPRIRDFARRTIYWANQVDTRKYLNLPVVSVNDLHTSKAFVSHPLGREMPVLMIHSTNDEVTGIGDFEENKGIVGRVNPFLETLRMEGEMHSIADTIQPLDGGEPVGNRSVLRNSKVYLERLEAFLGAPVVLDVA